MIKGAAKKIGAVPQGKKEADHPRSLAEFIRHEVDQGQPQHGQVQVHDEGAGKKQVVSPHVPFIVLSVSFVQAD
jgi:hypothetical protein